MQRLYFVLFLFLIPILLIGCAEQSADAKSLEEDQKSTQVPLVSSRTPTQIEVVSSLPAKNCPITVPQNPPFVPPAPYSDLGWEGYFWYGSNSLWVSVPQNGVWAGLPKNPGGYTQKVFWWREGYIWNEEPEPALAVTGERLDGNAPPLSGSRATNAYAGDIGSAMLVGVDFPTLGCWKITGKYRDAELSFVVWVAP